MGAVGHSQRWCSRCQMRAAPSSSASENMFDAMIASATTVSPTRYQSGSAARARVRN